MVCSTDCCLGRASIPRGGWRRRPSAPEMNVFELLRVRFREKRKRSGAAPYLRGSYSSAKANGAGPDTALHIVAREEIAMTMGMTSTLHRNTRGMIALSVAL